MSDIASCELYLAHSLSSLFELTTMTAAVAWRAAWISGKTGRRLTMLFSRQRHALLTEMCRSYNFDRCMIHRLAHWATMFMVQDHRCPVYRSESVQPVSSNPVRQRLCSASSLHLQKNFL